MFRGLNIGARNNIEDSSNKKIEDLQNQLMRVTESLNQMGQQFQSVLQRTQQPQQGQQPQHPSHQEEVESANKEIQKMRPIWEMSDEELQSPDIREQDKFQYLAKYLMSEIENKIDSSLKGFVDENINPIKDEIKQFGNQYYQKQGQENLNKLRNERGSDGSLIRPDFNDWTNEMLDIKKNYPNVPLEDLYTLAKSRNPQKAEQLQRKYNPEKFKRDSFGGLSPIGNVNFDDSGNIDFSGAENIEDFAAATLADFERQGKSLYNND